MEHPAALYAVETQPKPKNRIAPLKLLDIGAWSGTTPAPLRWLVPGLLLRGTVTLLAGDGGIGKSLLALQLLVACATGQQWLGLDVARVKCFALLCEDDADVLQHRIRDVCNHYGVNEADVAENLMAATRVGEDAVLVNYGRWDGSGRTTDLYDQVLTEVTDFGAQIVLLDTAADVFGGTEFVRPQVRHFINTLRKIALAQDGGVLLTSHPSNVGISEGHGRSGSTAWHNSVRARAYLTRPGGDAEDTKRRELRLMKSNYAPSGTKIPLEWSRGVFVRNEPVPYSDEDATPHWMR
ncbi:MAG: AAA family ATPase [Patescibacteria group bacterium]|nr:AAA family ATPase [Patescibacteria group bacterium]